MLSFIRPTLSLNPFASKIAISLPLSRNFAAKLAQGKEEGEENGPKHFVFSTNDHPLDKDSSKQRDPMYKKSGKSYMLFEPVYTKEQVEGVKVTHLTPTSWQDRLAFGAITMIRGSFDFITGYGRTRFDESRWLQRIVFLETVAGVPGMVGGMHRHMRSLRNMTRDNGWIHTLLEECENERMHLLTFLKLKNPGLFFRSLVLVGQGVFFNLYFASYMISPKFCHRFVGYLEEEAVKTYSHLIEEIDKGHLPQWTHTIAPEIARNYWHLDEKATIKDLMMAVRADEANHRDVNHGLSSIPQDLPNPFSFSH